MQANPNPFAIIISFILLFFMTACTLLPYTQANYESVNADNKKKLSEITMIYLDKSKKFPIKTRISLVNHDNLTISYLKKIMVLPHQIEEVKDAWGTSAFKKIEKSWKTELQNQDFVYIENISKKCCEHELNIFTISDADFMVNISDKSCANGSYIKFYVKSQTRQENAWTIPSEVLCEDKYLQPGLRQLIREIKDLVPKYQPTVTSQVAYNLKSCVCNTN